MYLPQNYYKIKLSLGDNLMVSVFNFHTARSVVFNNCRFIKVTRKGFNILNLDTNVVLLKRHLYAIGMGGKEYPEINDQNGDNQKSFIGQKRNCPSCKHWWFNRNAHGCILDKNRRTNTTYDLSSQEAQGQCVDFSLNSISKSFRVPNWVEIKIKGKKEAKNE